MQIFATYANLYKKGGKEVTKALMSESKRAFIFSHWQVISTQYSPCYKKLVYKKRVLGRSKN